MKVLFAIGNAQTSKSVADKYYQTYGEKLEYKDVFYFRALLEEVRRDSTYERIVISEELEPIKAVTIEEVDRVIFSNMDVLTDEAQNASIAFIGSDRRTKSDSLMSRFYNLGVYSILLGNDRNIASLCDVIKEPRTKKQAREYLDMNPAANASATSRTLDDDEIDESQLANILKHYEKLGEDTSKYISSFESIEEQYTRKQLVTIAAAISVYLPSIVSETIGNDPRYASMFEMVKSKKNNAKGANAQQKGNQKKPGILKFLSNKKDKPDTYSRKIVDESAKMQGQEEENARIAAQKAQEEAKRIREESERQAREQAEKLQKEKEERVAKELAELKRKQEEQKAQEEAQKQAAEQEVLRQRMILEQKKKEDEQRREQEALRQKAIEEQQEREEAKKRATEQEELRKRALGEQLAKENAQKQAIPEIEIDISDLKKPVSTKPQVNNTISEIEIDISDLQKANKPNNQEPVVEAKVQGNDSVAEQEALRQRALAEQKAREEAQRKAVEQEELRQKALAEQKAREEAQRKAAEQEALRQKALAEQKAREEAQRKAAEQEALRQKALAEQKAREEAQKQAAEQEALRQKALAEQKAREEAQKQVAEQEALRQKALEEQKLREEAERIVREQMQKEHPEYDVTATATNNNALISTDYDNDPLQSNFDIKSYQLPSDYKKVIAIVGTSKVGSTFLVNAIANSASEKKIQTAVLDMTKSKGLYYLYNKSDTKKIQIAAECIKKLNEGINTPISVDKNRFLNIYTSLPGLGENRKNYKHKTIIDTIKKTCNLLIIDCDFTTPIEYFEQASEIYIVQDMDLIKLQETTAFLREFKNRGIDWSKLNVIINKYVKSSFTPKKIVEVGLAYYNDPQMTYTEEFEVIKSYITVPFTIEDYARYTEDVARDKIVYKNYSIQLRSAIDQICQKIYPSNDSGKRKGLFK